VGADTQSPDCRNWWSQLDNVRHCLSDVVGKETTVVSPQVEVQQHNEICPECAPPPDDVQERTGPGYLTSEFTGQED
jgi:hypothetical protein